MIPRAVPPAHIFFQQQLLPVPIWTPNGFVLFEVGQPCQRRAAGALTSLENQREFEMNELTTVNTTSSLNDTTREAVLYARVSSKDQERGGFSIPAQQNLLRGYARANDIAIVAEFTDVETAGRAGRSDFGAMLQFLEHQPSCRAILVEKTDRLYRNLKDWVTLDELGVEVHLVKEGVVLSEKSVSSEKLVHGIKVLVAKNFIDNLSEETRKGMQEKARQGLWPSRAPLGNLNVTRVDGKRVIVPDPELGPLVARAFEWYVTGRYGITELTSKARDVGLVYRQSREAAAPCPNPYPTPKPPPGPTGGRQCRAPSSRGYAVEHSACEPSPQ